MWKTVAWTYGIFVGIFIWIDPAVVVVGVVVSAGVALAIDFMGNGL